MHLPYGSVFHMSTFETLLPSLSPVISSSIHFLQMTYFILLYER
jgi:hypothetical protein